MIDQLRQLAIFAKAIDHGSFRGAADELRLSPSVVSHHISQLEENLGVALIYRSTRKLRLTREGERLLVAARNMLAAVEGELLELSTVAGEPSGELRVTAPSVLARSPFMDMIAAFLAAYPRVRLTLDFSDERRALIDDGLDLAIRMAFKAKNSPTTRKLFQVRRRLVAAPTFLDAQPALTEPAELRDWGWLELAPVRSPQITFRKGRKEQVVNRAAALVSCNDAQALYRLARAGAGLAIIPEFLATEDFASGNIAYPLPDWAVDPVEVFAHWPANAPRHGLIKLLVDELSSSGVAAGSA